MKRYNYEAILLNYKKLWFVKNAKNKENEQISRTREKKVRYIRKLLDIATANKDKLYLFLSPIGETNSRLYVPIDKVDVGLRRVIIKEANHFLCERESYYIKKHGK